MEAQTLYQICQKSSTYETGICSHSRDPENPQERLNYRELCERAEKMLPRSDDFMA